MMNVICAGNISPGLDLWALCCFKTTSFNKWQDMDSPGEKKISAYFCAKRHALEAVSAGCLWTLCRSSVGLCGKLKVRLHVSCWGNDTAEKTIATTTALFLWWPFISLQPLKFRQCLAELKRDRDQNPLKIYNAIILWTFFPPKLKDSLVVCMGLCTWNLQPVMVVHIPCLLLFKEHLEKTVRKCRTRLTLTVQPSTRQLDHAAQCP